MGPFSAMGLRYRLSSLTFQHRSGTPRNVNKEDHGTTLTTYLRISSHCATPSAPCIHDGLFFTKISFWGLISRLLTVSEMKSILKVEQHVPVVK